MKEFKFRVYQNEKMDYTPDLFYSDLLYVGYIDGSGCPYIENAKLMQYTGLKDINGKEIYEGDIVKHGSLIGELYQEVIFEDGAYHLCFRRADLKLLLYKDFITRNNLSVIGNIYENPELLENK